MKNKKVCPEVHVLVKRVVNLTDREYGQLRRLCYRKNCGIMRDNLINARNRRFQSKSTVVMAKVKNSDQVLSWAMIDGDRCSAEMDNHLPEVCYWTQRRWRRLGLGRMVGDTVAKIIGSIYDHYPEQNPKFFKAIGAKKYTKSNIH